WRVPARSARLPGHLRTARYLLPVRPMIRISREELREVASVYVVANTPSSMLGGLLRTSAVRRLRSESIGDLAAYYDFVTTRARRTEVSMGLAYAILVSIHFHAHPVPGTRPHLDASRLQWGSIIEEQAKSKAPTTQIVVPARHMKTNVISAPSNPLILPRDPR